ncbi:MAG: hypothetical protein ABIH23_08435 [bacterium]
MTLTAVELKSRLAREAAKKWPSRFFIPNGKQEEFLRAVGREEARHIVFSAGNGVGKTAVGANVLAQIIYGQHGRWTNDCPLFQNWPYARRGRILATPKNLEEKIGAIDVELTRWLAPGTYKRSKGNQKYWSLYEFPEYGWSFDLMTFEQDVSELAGPTLGLVWSDEPMPATFWGEISSRLRMGGIYICTMTPLGDAAWMFDKSELQDPAWRFVFADTEANCISCGVRGRLRHEDVQAMIESYPPEEREARTAGKFMFLSGRIYKDWGDQNIITHDKAQVVEDLNGEDSPTLYMIIDPHDVKPWVITWWAVYKDGRKICFMEWPDASMKPYHEIEQYRIGMEEYATIIRAKEHDLKVYRRILDKRYGFTYRMQGRGAVTIAQELRRYGGADFRFSPSQGEFDTQHHLVESEVRPREIIAEDGTLSKSPRIFADRLCRNLDYSMRRYMWRKNRGRTLDVKDRIAAKPQEKFKCFPNTVEYFMACNPKWIHPDLWLNEPEDEFLMPTGTAAMSGIRTGYNY